MELFYYLTAENKKFYFTLTGESVDKWKRFFLECGGIVYKEDYDHFLTTIDNG